MILLNKKLKKKICKNEIACYLQNQMRFKSTHQNFKDKNNELIWKYFLNPKQFHKHTSCLITFLYPLDASVL